jgi:hypothetical protein
VIEKDEGPDHATGCVGKHAPYFEAAEIATALIDHQVQHEK